MRVIERLMPLARAALLAACGEQTLYAKLDERQANDMVSALRLAGVAAQKTAKEDGFEVRTAESDFARAVQILKSCGVNARFCFPSVISRSGCIRSCAGSIWAM